MTWMKGHPRATLGIMAGIVAAAQLSILLGGFGPTTLMLIALVPYAILAAVNGWVLRLRGRTRHWLWLYLFYNWGGAIIPLCVALFASEKPVDNQVRALGA